MRWRCWPQVYPGWWRSLACTAGAGIGCARYASWSSRSTPIRPGSSSGGRLRGRQHSGGSGSRCYPHMRMGGGKMSVRRGQQGSCVSTEGQRTSRHAGTPRTTGVPGDVDRARGDHGRGRGSPTCGGGALRVGGQPGARSRWCGPQPGRTWHGALRAGTGQAAEAGLEYGRQRNTNARRQTTMDTDDTLRSIFGNLRGGRLEDVAGHTAARSKRICPCHVVPGHRVLSSMGGWQRTM